MSKEATKW